MTGTTDAPEIEQVAEAIHAARFGPDYPASLERDTLATTDRSGREYCYRLARAAIEALAHRTPAEDIAGLVATEPPKDRTILVFNAGGFDCPALVKWYKGYWRQVTYQGVICESEPAIISFDAWIDPATALSAHAADIAGRDAAVVAQIVAMVEGFERKCAEGFKANGDHGVGCAREAYRKMLRSIACGDYLTTPVAQKE